MRALSVILASAVLGCGGDDKSDLMAPDTGTESDADTDADTDSDTDTDVDTDTDTDTDTTDPGGYGFLVRVGQATVGAGYVGTEELQLLGNGGYGEPVCRIAYDVTSTGTRADCADCTWAFDVVYANATVLQDDGACLSGTGYDASNVATLDGTVSTRGYNPDYVGHAQVLLTDVGGVWTIVSYVEYDAATGTLTYEWDDGFVTY